MTALDNYFIAVPDSQAMAFAALRNLIKDCLPDATEDIWYSMPTLKLNGKAIVSYAAFKNHVSIFPLSAAVIASMADDLKEYKTSKGTIQFSKEKPATKELVGKVVQLRLAEVAAGKKMRGN